MYQNAPIIYTKYLGQFRIKLVRKLKARSFARYHFVNNEFLGQSVRTPSPFSLAAGVQSVQGTRDLQDPSLKKAQLRTGGSCKT